ncbi:hypothetical protein WOB96_14295 [Thermithiobacillus plumbiphilus]|uniref:Transposase n=1 Tax=Thermithiobacillus plumbiphilus TaxID=1729899 RepID=A0ABU9DBP2_9PROT
MDAPYDQASRFVNRFCRNLDQIGITPQQLGLNKVNPVFRQIALALPFVKFKGKHGMKIIPLPPGMQ